MKKNPYGNKYVFKMENKIKLVFGGIVEPAHAHAITLTHAKNNKPHNTYHSISIEHAAD